MEQAPTVLLVKKHYFEIFSNIHLFIIFSNIIEVFRLSAKPSKPTRKDKSCILAIVCSLYPDNSVLDNEVLYSQNMFLLVPI